MRSMHSDLTSRLVVVIHSIPVAHSGMPVEFWVNCGIAILRFGPRHFHFNDYQDLQADSPRIPRSDLVRPRATVADHYPSGGGSYLIHSVR